MARVFLSYSRKDREFVDRLAAGLEARGVDVSRDVDDLLPAAEWRVQLERMIEAADTVVFVVSPDAIASAECAWEIELVGRLQKRLAPVIWREVENDRVPADVARMHYVWFTPDRDFALALDGLVAALDTDIEWLSEHTRIGAMARRWDADGRPRAAALRGRALEGAERWMAAQPKSAPAPTASHRDFVAASRRAATERQRGWIGGALAIAVASAALAGFALIQRSRALDAQSRAETIQFGQASLLAKVSEDQARAGNSASALNLAVNALPHDLAKPDRKVSDAALAALFFAVDQDRRYLTLAGHANAVQFAAFSPDGRRILTTSSDKTARLWDARSGELIHVLPGADDVVVYAAFSPDGRRIVTTAGEAARVWDADSGRLLFQLVGHKKNIQRVAFTPDGRRIVTGAWDNTARVWDAATGACLFVLAAPDWDDESSAAFGGGDPIVAAVTRAQNQIFGGMEGVAISPDGRRVVTGGRADSRAVARLWSLESGKLERELTGVAKAMGNLFLDLRFSPDGLRVAAAVGDGTVRVWSVATGDPLLTLRGDPGAALSGFECLRYSPDGRLILAGSVDGSARIWDAATGEPRQVLRGHKEWVNAVDFSPDGASALTASSDGGLRVWDVATGALRLDLVGDEAANPFFVRADASGGVQSLGGGPAGETRDRMLAASFSPDGRYIVSASRGKVAAVWRVGDGDPARTFGGDAAAAQSPRSDDIAVRDAPGGRRLFVGQWLQPQSGALLDPRDGAFIARIEGERGVFNPDGAVLLTFAKGGAGLQSWTAADGRHLRSFEGTGLALAGRFLAVGRGSWLVVANFSTGETLADIDCGAPVSAAALTPEAGRAIVVCDGKLSLWEVKGARRIADLAGLAGVPQRLALAPGGEALAAYDDAGALALWSTRDGAPIPLANAAGVEFVAARFDPGGRLLRGVRRDGGFALWRVADGGSVLSLAKRPLSGATVAETNFLPLGEPSEADDVFGGSSGFSPSLPYATQIPSAFTGGRLLALDETGVLWRAGADGVDHRALRELAPECDGESLFDARLLAGGRLVAVFGRGGDTPSFRLCAFDTAAQTGVVLADMAAAPRLSEGQSDARGRRFVLPTPAGVETYDLATGRREAQSMATPQADALSALRLDRAGGRALISDNGASRLWDAATGAPLATLAAADVEIHDAAGVVSGVVGDALWIWRLEDGAPLGRLDLAPPMAAAPTQGVAEPPYRLLADGRYALNLSGDLFDVGTGKLLQNGVVSVDRAGRRAVVTGSKKDDAPAPPTRVIDIATAAVLLTLPEGRGAALDLKADGGPWLDGSKTLAAHVGADGRLRLWSLIDAKPVATLDTGEAKVTAAAFAAGVVAVGASDRTLRIFGPSWTGPPSRIVGDLPSAPVKLAYAPAGDRVAALLADGSARLWSTPDWKPVPLAGAEDVIELEFSPDGRTLALKGAAQAMLFEAAAGRRLGAIPANRWDSIVFNAAGDCVEVDGRTAFRLDGTALPQAEDDRLLDVGAAHALFARDPGKLVIRLLQGGAEVEPALPAPVVAARLAPGDAYAVARLETGAVAIVPVNAPGPAKLVEAPFLATGGERGGVIGFSADGRDAVVSAGGAAAALIDVAGGALRATLSGRGEIEQAAVSDDGAYVLTRTRDGWTVWDRKSGARRGGVVTSLSDELVLFAAGPSGLRAVVDETPNPRIDDPLSGAAVGALKPADAREEDQRDAAPLFPTRSDAAAALAELTPDGETLMRSRAAEVECWDVASGKKRASAVTDKAVTALVGVAPGRIAAIYDDGRAALWDARACRSLAGVDMLPSLVGGVTASPDGKTFATTAAVSYATEAAKRDPSIWDAATGRRIAVLESGQPPDFIRYDPTGRYLLTVPRNGATWLWSVADGKFLRNLSAHGDAVAKAVFSPDGHWLATAASGDIIEIDDVETGRRAHTLHVAQRGVAGLAFSHDGRRLAYALRGGGLAAVDLASERTLIERRNVGANLTQVAFAGERDDMLAVDGKGAVRVYRLAPVGVDATPSWQDLIDFARIRVEAGAAGAEGAPGAGDCDRLASDPQDSARRAPPVALANIDAKAALAACEKATEANPGELRLRHERARALEAAGQDDKAAALLKQTAAAGYRASRLALAVQDMGRQDTRKAAQATLQDLADAGDGSAANLLGLSLWRQAADAEGRRKAIRLLEAAAAKDDPFAHENLAQMLASWPTDPVATRERLYHWLAAARLYLALGETDRSATALSRAEALSRLMPFADAAAAARKARGDT